MLKNSSISAVLPAMDLPRAKRFYNQTLGLPIEREDEEGITFTSGDCTRLFVYPRSTPTKADHTEAGWQVDNIEAEVRELKSRGVKFEQYDMPGLKTNADGIATTGNSKAAWFKDPEGNILALTQM